MIGKTLAHYQILEKIGAGGMGEVYRANDSKLGRDVALKILPPAFAEDAERMARFQREAQVLAQLNHPNIAAIYGLETAGDSTALVLELVEGPTLEERIRSGPVPWADALQISHQIAEAIESAHESGIVHRDLKPANVKLTPDGQVKVLDFGLAKAFEGDPAQSASGSLDSPTISPALTSPAITGALTGVNVILGTAAYMSPEQARGQVVDKRSDIWAFGVVCFEMLTGRRLFDGGTVSDTLAAVLKTDPDWDALPPDIPEPLRRLLRRCLERDPRKRLRDIGEARVRMEEWWRDPASLEALHRAPAASQRARGALVPWALAAVAAAAAVFLWLGRPAPEPAPKLRVPITLPGQAALGTNSGVNIQLSPDGKLLAYRTRAGIRVRPLDKIETIRLKGTEDALQFTFSPDGRWIAFIANGQLRRVSVDGGAPIGVCDADLVARGLTWVNPSTIVFTPNFVGGMRAVSLETGEIRDITTVDQDAGERTHRWPTALPDGRGILFLCQYHEHDYDEGEIRMLRLGESAATTVYRGGAAPLYSPSGHLLFAKDNTVFAVPMDVESGTTSGLAEPVLSEVWARVNDQESDDGSAQFAVSPQGTLVYQTEPARLSVSIMELDVATKEVRSLTDPGPIMTLLASPDGRSLAYRQGEEIHFLNLTNGGSTQLSYEGSRQRLGAWSADSRTLFWESTGGDSIRLLSRPIDGADPASTIITIPSRSGRPTSVSPDGERMLLSEWLGDRGGDEWGVVLLSLSDPESGTQIVVDDRNYQASGQFSPDGRWLSYRAADGEMWGLRLRRFPDTGATWTLHTGNDAFYSYRWLADGTGIVFHHGTGAYRIPLDLRSGNPEIGRAERLLAEGVVPRSEAALKVAFSPDGSKVYFLRSAGGKDDEADETAVVLVTDWFDELEALAPR